MYNGLEEGNKRKQDIARLKAKKGRKNRVEFGHMEFRVLEGSTLSIPMIWEEEVIETKMFNKDNNP